MTALELKSSAVDVMDDISSSMYKLSVGLVDSICPERPFQGCGQPSPGLQLVGGCEAGPCPDPRCHVHFPPQIATGKSPQTSEATTPGDSPLALDSDLRSWLSDILSECRPTARRARLGGCFPCHGPRAHSSPDGRRPCVLILMRAGSLPRMRLGAVPVPFPLTPLFSPNSPPCSRRKPSGIRQVARLQWRRGLHHRQGRDHHQ